MAVMKIAVTKGKDVVEIDTDALPTDVYAEALYQGLKVLVNRGMSKITKAELGSEETVKAEAMIKARANVADILEGKIKFTGKSAGKAKVSGAIKTEAMRIARNRVKDAIKAAGMKISYVKASDITAAATQLLSDDPTIIEQAKAALEAREATPMPIDIKALVAEDAKLREKGEAKKAAEKAERGLSAKQAGKVAGRKPKAKPTAEATA